MNPWGSVDSDIAEMFLLVTLLCLSARVLGYLVEVNRSWRKLRKWSNERFRREEA